MTLRWKFAPQPDPCSFTCDDRQWRVRGLETQLCGLRLRVNLLVMRQGLSHVDTLDLYSARQRRMFLQEAAAELYVEETVLKGDLGRVLWQLEEHQEQLQQMSTYVGQRAQQQRIAPEQVRFTQRQLREAISWSDHSLRRQLTPLVELEYVLTYRTGQGKQRAYQLLYGGQGGNGTPRLWGLTDVHAKSRVKRGQHPVERPMRGHYRSRSNSRCSQARA